MGFGVRSEALCGYFVGGERFSSARVEL